MANAHPLEPASRLRPTYIVLAIGLLASSLAAVFIRLAQDAGIPSLLIAAGRLTIATLILTPITLQRHRHVFHSLTRRDLTFIVISGAFLAIHFITWITSLELTSVLISVVLVSTAPLWIAILEQFFLNIHLSRTVLFSLLMAITGGIIISLPTGNPQLQLGSNLFLGSLMALAGAVAIAVYLVIGRNIRAKMPLLPYIWMVYGLAAVLTSFVVLLSATPVTGYEPQGYLWVLAIALIPQLIGHSAFNFALRHLPATLVGVIGQLEPAGSTMMAVVLFNEIPHAIQLIGSVVVVVGVILAILSQTQSKGS